jgi:RimJ/RimL family protein N-acetyltransferase
MVELKIVSSDSTNQHFCNWLSRRTGVEFPFDPTLTRTIGHVETTDGKTFSEEQILAVTAYHNFTPYSCEVTLASSGAKKQKASKEYVRFCLHYCFNLANKLRLEAHIAVDNYKSQCIADLLCLKRLCTKKDFYGEGKDAFMYELTKKDWLTGPWAVVSTTEPINKEKNGEE